ncbi:MAG: hypothetical protein AAF512_14410, partial [Pseudomonadota bacterium]
MGHLLEIRKSATERLNSVIIALILALLLLAGCDLNQLTPHEKAAREVESIPAWVELTDPAEMAYQDIKSGQIKFLQVCSYSCGTVGIGRLNASKCFPDVAQIPIKGTSDVIMSKEHHRLMNTALEFTKRYNRFVMHSLYKQG